MARASKEEYITRHCTSIPGAQVSVAFCSWSSHPVTSCEVKLLLRKANAMKRIQGGEMNKPWKQFAFI